MKNLILFIYLLLMCYLCCSQSVGISNEPTFVPDVNTVLDIKALGSGSSDYGLKVKDGSGVNLFVIQGDGNVGLGVDNPSSQFHLKSNSGISLFIESDADNLTETDVPIILFSQDGGAITGFVGLEGTAGQTSANTSANSMLLGSKANINLSFVTNDISRVSIRNNGELRVNNLAGTGDRVLVADPQGDVKTSGYPVPSGGIIMWSGTLASIPTGWALCDGSNGTPDLRNRFIMSVPDAVTNPGATGGASSQILTAANLPTHSHGAGSLANSNGGVHNHGGTTNNGGDHNHSGTSLSATAVGNHSHGVGSYFIWGDSHNHGASTGWTGVGRSSYTTTVDAWDGGSSRSVRAGYTASSHNHSVLVGMDTHWHNFTGSSGGAGSHGHSITGNTTDAGSHNHSFTTNNGGSHTHTISGSTGNSGSGTSFDNRPLFYQLAFIMKL